MPTLFNRGASPVNITNSDVTAQAVAGTRFEDLYKSNPYAQNPRQRTFWDRVLNFLGMRSGYDRANEEFSLAGQEYNAQLAQLASEEQYNSPAAQAARMRQAGQNPDLLGTDGVSPASEFDNQQQSPNVGASAAEDLEKVGALRTAFGTFASNALGLMGSVGSIVDSGVGIIGKIQDINSKSIGQIGDIIDAVEKLTPSLMDSLRDMDDPSKISDFLKKDYSEVLRPLVPNSLMRKRVIDYLSKYYGSMQNVANEYNAKSAADIARESFNTRRGQFVFNERDDLFQEGVRILSKGTYEVQKAMNKYQSQYLTGLKPNSRSWFENAQNAYNAQLFQSLDGAQAAAASNATARFTEQYQSQLNPVTQADASNAEAELRKVNADREKALQQVYSEVQKSYMQFMSWLARRASKGSNWAQIMMIRLQGQQGSPIPPLFGSKGFSFGDLLPNNTPSQSLLGPASAAFGSPAAGAAATGASAGLDFFSPFDPLSTW